MNVLLNVGPPLRLAIAPMPHERLGRTKATRTMPEWYAWPPRSGTAVRAQDGGSRQGVNYPGVRSSAVRVDPRITRASARAFPVVTIRLPRW